MNSPKEIIVGANYYHVEYPNEVWIGAGKRTMWTGQHTNLAPMDEKFLVLVETDRKEFRGLVAKSGDDAMDGYFAGFRLI